MTLMSDLPPTLVEKILSRVPITSLRAVRSTRKEWNALSKKQIFGNQEANQQFLGFVMMDYKVCSVRFDLHGIQNDKEVFVDPSIKQTGQFSQGEISYILHCDGLLLCVTWDNSRLVVWNPYLGQTRWIEPKTPYYGSDSYAFGYDSNNGRRNHKIVRFLGHCNYEIYDLNSNSWKDRKVSPWRSLHYFHDVSLKGNTYMIVERDEDEDFYKPCFLLCFDFTRESFGQLLELPFDIDIFQIVTLSTHRDEKLALLQQDNNRTLQIWVTTKIEHNAVSWSNLFKFDMALHDGFYLRFENDAGAG